MRLGSVSVPSLMQIPGKEHTSLEIISSANGCFHTSQRSVASHPLPFLSCTGCYRMSRLGCLTQLQLMEWVFLFSLQSSKAVLQGHLRFQGNFIPFVCPCKLLPPGKSQHSPGVSLAQEPPSVCCYALLSWETHLLQSCLPWWVNIWQEGIKPSQEFSQGFQLI